ncbi:iron-sulfur cluster biosynthesis family protein [Lacticaseibacillus mingshuiensis]|uniref:iron-sulfur cluster biosynthesis family protein n=1 Tax=Lacticaseibacillus mingshuiensis TaxID=2799574 RepID=UPI00194E5C9A|nr:iron-sulfur cluster biosynthesis family protein [Lacticaseibacillus mingshuiensis]
MQINIKPAAMEYLQGKVAKDQHLFLALDDGSSKFSKLGGSCAIGNKFQLVRSNQADSDYDVVIDNNADLNLTTAMPETMYLGHGLALDHKLGALVLSDDSGMLDGAVTIEDAPEAPQDDDAKRKEMETLGGKIC